MQERIFFSRIKQWVTSQTRPLCLLIKGTHTERKGNAPTRLSLLKPYYLYERQSCNKSQVRFIPCTCKPQEPRILNSSNSKVPKVLRAQYKTQRTMLPKQELLAFSFPMELPKDNFKIDVNCLYILRNMENYLHCEKVLLKKFH